MPAKFPDDVPGSVGSFFCLLAACLVSGLVLVFGAGCQQQASETPTPTSTETSTVSQVPTEQVPGEAAATEAVSPAVESALAEGMSVQPEPVEALSPIAEALARLSADDLQQLGISQFESARFQLLADQLKPEEKAEFAQIPPAIDQLVQWVKTTYPAYPFDQQLGDRFQLQACIMRDQKLFLQAGLLPEDLADLAHGKDRGTNFWMLDQPTAYYRRHLAFHEAMHCLMNQQPHQWPVWYLEGMAELAGNHQQDITGRYQFGIMPGPEQVQGGFGRLQILREELKQGRFRSMDEVQQLNFRNFYPHKTSYGWAWAFCYFLAHHPETADGFVRLSGLPRESPFQTELQTIIARATPRLQADWLVFLQSLTPGYDFARSLISWEPLGDEIPLLNPGEQVSLSLAVDRHWQNSGLSVQADQLYALTATGSYLLKTRPVPWECEPQGVSIEYHQGRPLGELQLMVLPLDQTAAPSTLPEIVPVGRELQFIPPRAGRLFFRINENPADWADNTGAVQIHISRL